jgi:hypothetical protein
MFEMKVNLIKKKLYKLGGKEKIFTTRDFILILGVCILLRVWDQVMGISIPSTQLHYRRLILLLNTTYTATCFGCTTIFKQKYIIS